MSNRNYLGSKRLNPLVKIRTLKANAIDTFIMELPTNLSSLTKADLIELVVRQAALIEQLEERVKGLEGRLNKDSHNSHLPPSQSPFKKKIKNLRKQTGKKPGGQKGHPGSTLQMVEQADEEVLHQVTTCQSCGKYLGNIIADHHEKRQVFDGAATVCRLLRCRSLSIRQK